MKSIFTNIYQKNLWHMNQNESKSGMGSTMNYTTNLRQILPEIIKNYSIKSFIDTSCGDWNWMKLIKNQLDCQYIGIDIVEDIINLNNELYSNDKTTFINTNMLEYLKTLPDRSIDLVLSRHTCEHLSTDYIINFLMECMRVSKHLLITNYELITSNIDLQQSNLPYRPINLKLSPYVELLGKYYMASYYDGPADIPKPEMQIYLYGFS